jgi:hypothetical protein
VRPALVVDLAVKLALPDTLGITGFVLRGRDL